METKSYRGGAPEKPMSEKRKRRVEVRFNEGEYQQLARRNASAQTTDLSAFIRAICLDKPLRLKPPITTHEEKLLALIREIRTDILRIGVNVNQAVKRINSTTDYHAMQREVTGIVTNMARFEAQLETMQGMINRASREQTLNQSGIHGSPNQ